MIQATCMGKYRDEKGIIMGYSLKDDLGAQFNMKKEELKNAIKEGKINVENLKIDVKDRIIETKSNKAVNMNEDEFWRIVANVKKVSGNISDGANMIKYMLTKVMAKPEANKFRDIAYAMYLKLQKEEVSNTLIKSIGNMAGNVTENQIDNYYTIIIYLGKEVYYELIENPQNLELVLRMRGGHSIKYDLENGKIFRDVIMENRK